jgi:hypothetical protein
LSTPNIPGRPQRDQPNQWPGFTPPSSAHRRRSIGLVCHRRAHNEHLINQLGGTISDDDTITVGGRTVTAIASLIGIDSEEFIAITNTPRPP